jgi:hypothetical protein
MKMHPITKFLPALLIIAAPLSSNSKFGTFGGRHRCNLWELLRLTAKTSRFEAQEMRQVQEHLAVTKIRLLDRSSATALGSL